MSQVNETKNYCKTLHYGCCFQRSVFLYHLHFECMSLNSSGKLASSSKAWRNQSLLPSKYIDIKCTIHRNMINSYSTLDTACMYNIQSKWPSAISLIALIACGHPCILQWSVVQYCRWQGFICLWLWFCCLLKWILYKHICNLWIKGFNWIHA